MVIKRFFPGSVHESGEPICFVHDGDPAPISKEALLGTIESLAAACVMPPLFAGVSSLVRGRVNFHAGQS